MVNKVKIMMGIVVVASCLIGLMGGQILADGTSPGTVNDPIVTRSYVELKFKELRTELMTLVDGLGTTKPVTETEPIKADAVDMAAVKAYVDQRFKDQAEQASQESEAPETPSSQPEVPETPSSEPTSETLFTVVKGLKDQKLICGASAEVILRAGNATVISGEQGDGLADLTTGEDLRGGEVVPLQHHLLVSRDDGRGLLILASSSETDPYAYILVKGAYRLE